jgi:hypothetical protein
MSEKASTLHNPSMNKKVLPKSKKSSILTASVTISHTTYEHQNTHGTIHKDTHGINTF